MEGSKTIVRLRSWPTLATPRATPGATWFSREGENQCGEVGTFATTTKASTRLCSLGATLTMSKKDLLGRKRKKGLTRSRFRFLVDARSGRGRSGSFDTVVAVLLCKKKKNARYESDRRRRRREGVEAHFRCPCRNRTSSHRIHSLTGALVRVSTLCDRRERGDGSTYLADLALAAARLSPRREPDKPMHPLRWLAYLGAAILARS